MLLPFVGMPVIILFICVQCARVMRERARKWYVVVCGAITNQNSDV